MKILLSKFGQYCEALITAWLRLNQALPGAAARWVLHSFVWEEWPRVLFIC
ncbi:hypothetical protein [Hymenobacter ruricola]|uniref:Uncharacterized protein n=1 Tax=Hymenobacter ruricola TaxID=2791023 RepID=A0ABS0I6V7_9BACT|nr:hypothetical protein [Hymenobacter ruricola]MBF9222287.1 hypothetical protein [Hymenobacter ruricola]